MYIICQNYIFIIFLIIFIYEILFEGHIHRKTNTICTCILDIAYCLGENGKKLKIFFKRTNLNLKLTAKKRQICFIKNIQTVIKYTIKYYN